MGSDLVFFLVFIETERKNSEVVEDSDVVGENVNDEVVDTFVFSEGDIFTGVVLLTGPVENDSVAFISEWEFEDKYLILSSDFGFIFVERFGLADLAVAEVGG